MVNYTVSFFLQKIDELHLCLDVVLRNKTPVNHTPSGVFTICLPTHSLFLLIKTDVLYIVHPYVAYSVTAFDAVLSKNLHLNLLKKKGLIFVLSVKNVFFFLSSLVSESPEILN